MNKLFISGFPLEISEMNLARLIAPHGDIDTLKIVRDRKTRICKGYAFIEMRTAEGAMNVIGKLDGTPVGDRNLTVNPVEEKAEAPAPKRPAAMGKPPGRTSAAYARPATDRSKRPRR